MNTDTIIINHVQLVDRGYKDFAERFAIHRVDDLNEPMSGGFYTNSVITALERFTEMVTL